jgi:RNA polymerase sigma-70 factor (ECF subfamily)
MQAAMSGDARAYKSFLVSVAPRLRSIVRRRFRATGGAEADAEDIVQEILLAIHLKRATWDRSRPIAPWISAIARNKVIDAFRRRGRHVAVPIEDVLESLEAEHQDEDRGLQQGEVFALLARLKERHQQVVQSISINGASVRETANRLQMSEVTVRVTLHRALKKLAELYRNQTP